MAQVSSGLDDELWEQLKVDFQLEAVGFPDNKIYGRIQVVPNSSRTLIKEFRVYSSPFSPFLYSTAFLLVVRRQAQHRQLVFRGYLCIRIRIQFDQDRPSFCAHRSCTSVDRWAHVKQVLHTSCKISSITEPRDAGDFFVLVFLLQRSFSFRQPKDHLRAFQLW